jgi:hypothetical protein
MQYVAMFAFYLQTKSQIPCSKCSVVIANKVKVTEHFCVMPYFVSLLPTKNTETIPDVFECLLPLMI